MEILAELLGGGATGILNRRLVMERRLAADVSASYDPAAIDETMFAINAIPKPGVALEDLERAIDEELNALAKTISKNPADLTRARQKLIMAGLQARDGTYKAALAVGAALATGAALTDFERRQDLISAVTPDDIAVAARDLFQPTRSVTSLLLVDR
jgi:zinc protease